MMSRSTQTTACSAHAMALLTGSHWQSPRRASHCGDHDDKPPACILPAHLKFVSTKLFSPGSHQKAKSRHEPRHFPRVHGKTQAKLTVLACLSLRKKRSPSKSRHVCFRILKNAFFQKTTRKKRLDFSPVEKLQCFKKHNRSPGTCFCTLRGFTRRKQKPALHRLHCTGGGGRRLLRRRMRVGSVACACFREPAAS